ncbi:MAG: PEP-CTERM sorting domain-containing protein [Planctomycetes bacterium]|nr:PEP-CTERM sorting domain-containing protein [Planctomycetota bacterium]
MKNLSLFLLAVAILSASAQALVLDNPKTGTFTLDENASPTVDFDQIPWTPAGSLGAVYLYPFASDDLYEKDEDPDTHQLINDNLASVAFSNVGYSVNSLASKTGDLGVRIGNYSNADQTLDATVMTLSFLNEDFDVYLPEFTIEKSQQMFFWVAESGSTYYANDPLGFADKPNIYAIDAMADPSTFLAREVPEPATIILLSLGAVLIVKKR